MKSILLQGTGGPEKLVMVDAPIPVPKAGEVLVRVKAASVNAVDRRVREGYLSEWIPKPYTAGTDFSGVVEAVGPGSDLTVGSKVFGGIAPNSGCYAEYVVYQASELATIPDGVSFEQAAALPVAGLTAWAAVMDSVKLAPGARVLIQGAAGGVGHLAVQLAKLAGAHVTATASEKNLDFVRSLGADQVLDYRQSGFEQHLHGLSLVVDGVSAAGMARIYPAMNNGATLVSLFEAPPPAPVGIRTQHVATKTSRDRLTVLAELVASGKLVVNISGVFPLSAAGLAQESGKQGKIVLRP
ncbi:NADP-dependent oxidoreductase [Duganella sp. SAP-35]|uniref:NADP-dependent oxidoreductase n=2 Tax=Duganella aceris TaxID=2703883 RepID=A0ABX0FVR2_9BURK|nr:NADP-dependent oxidoreductase [Duganella aceris]